MGDETVYSDLTEVCLAQVTLFNRKRSGEVQRVTLKPVMNFDIFTSLNKFKRELCKSLIEIRGKRGSIVSIPLTDKFQQNIAALVKARRMLQISCSLSQGALTQSRLQTVYENFH